MRVWAEGRSGRQRGVVLELGQLRAAGLTRAGPRARLVAGCAGRPRCHPDEPQCRERAYGFLAKAHIGHQVEGDIAFASRLADIDRRPVLRRRILADCASDLVPWPEAGVAALIRAHPELG